MLHEIKKAKNPRKALLTTVKEAVDNSLDACEEAGILPNVSVVIEDLQPDRPANAKQSRYRVTVVDNGPGIVRNMFEEKVRARLLSVPQLVRRYVAEVRHP